MKNTKRKFGMSLLLVSTLALAPLAMSGCATHQVSATTVDASGKPVTTTETTKASDSAVMSFLNTGLGAVRDTVNLILPPIIPAITKTITGTVCGSGTPPTSPPATAPAPAPTNSP